MKHSHRIAERFAARTGLLSASMVRELFSDTLAPDTISFAGGLPHISEDLTIQLSEATAKVMSGATRAALQYGPGSGSPEIREQIAAIMKLEGMEVSPDSVVVTTGSQNALELLGKLVLNPGDVVLVDTPCYITALVVFKSFQADVVHIEHDEKGMMLDALETSIADLRMKGVVPKMLYTVSNFNNPSGVSLAAERRQKLIDICADNNIILLEDNPYGLVRFADKPAEPNLRSLSDNVVYTGTFSKVLAPGFRVGWIVAPDVLRDKLVLANECAVLSPSSFAHAILAQYLTDNSLAEHIKTSSKLYHQKRDALLKALDEQLPDCPHTDPEGGFFCWLMLPGVDTRKLMETAIRNRVLFVPGTEFFANPSDGKNFVRLNYSFPSLEQIPVGVERIKATIAAHS